MSMFSVYNYIQRTWNVSTVKFCRIQSYKYLTCIVLHYWPEKNVPLCCFWKRPHSSLAVWLSCGGQHSSKFWLHRHGGSRRACGKVVVVDTHDTQKRSNLRVKCARLREATNARGYTIAGECGKAEAGGVPDSFDVFMLVCDCWAVGPIKFQAKRLGIRWVSSVRHLVPPCRGRQQLSNTCSEICSPQRRSLYSTSRTPRSERPSWFPESRSISSSSPRFQVTARSCSAPRARSRIRARSDRVGAIPDARWRFGDVAWKDAWLLHICNKYLLCSVHVHRWNSTKRKKQYSSTGYIYEIIFEIFYVVSTTD